MQNYVIITKAEEMDYLHDFVSLPKSYGTAKYYNRKDIQAILHTVEKNLENLNEKSQFLEKLKGKKVIIKPNLVTVLHNLGFKERDYPQSTDPRVIDAVILFIKPYAKEIIIAESSGRGVPTRLSFKIAGLDRLAKHHKIKLTSLDEQPVDRYILPKAKVMREIYIPKLFSEVVKGEAFYISMPKMKTNLYTEVTLGFKNAMGIIPYNLRQRNHNYRLREKVVDILFLIKPNLVIIDGLIGGEGNTPAPVIPVKSNLIISGTNCVETDRVASEIMGFNPDKIELISSATKMGFADPEVQVFGDRTKIPFTPADCSLLSNSFIQQFPNVRLLVGHMKNNAPKINNPSEITPEIIKEMEKVCIGGCIASIRTAFDYIKFQGHTTDFEITIIIGAGVEIAGLIYYFDKKGQAYTSRDITKLPGKKLAMGTCSMKMKEVASSYIPGCMPKPIEPVFKIFKLLKIPNYNLNPFRNKYLIYFIITLLQQFRSRKKLLDKGMWIDCELEDTDKLYEIRSLTENEKQLDFIEWPLPQMTKEMKKPFIKLER